MINKIEKQIKAELIQILFYDKALRKFIIDYDVDLELRKGTNGNIFAELDSPNFHLTFTLLWK